MPSTRLFAVIALIALGGLAAVFGAGGSDTGQVDTMRGGLVSGQAGAALDVAAENQQTGTNGWRISPSRAAADGLAGYAGAVSATAGEQVPLYLRARGTVAARAFRLGWYDGVGARQVWAGSFTATGQSGAASTWSQTGTLDTTGWPEGSYLIRLDRAKASRYVSLTITSGASAAGRTVLLTSPLTWAASDTNGSGAQRRSLRPDRPLTTGAGGGGLVAAAGLIAQIESTGVGLVYLTDADLAAEPDLVDGAEAVLVAGQSRYWTKQMRNSVRAALQSGTDLAVFGAGAGAGLLTEDADGFTVTDPAVSAAVRLTGVTAACSSTRSTGLTVEDASWWGFAGTGVVDAQVLPRLVSGAADLAPEVVGARTVASAALGCGATQVTSYIDKDSGGQVFNAGTAGWGCTVSGACENARGRRIAADTQAQDVAAAVTRNVVKAFAEAS